MPTCTSRAPAPVYTALPAKDTGAPCGRELVEHKGVLACPHCDMPADSEELWREFNGGVK